MSTIQSARLVERLFLDFIDYQNDKLSTPVNDLPGPYANRLGLLNVIFSGQRL